MANIFIAVWVLHSKTAAAIFCSAPAPGGAYETNEWIKTTPASMWRSTGDIMDSWESVKSLLRQQTPLFPYNGVGCFNDMDMLIVGMHGKGNVGLSGCTDTQYRTHFSAWAFLASPLMIGCDIRDLQPETLKILTNPDILAINQDSACREPFPVPGYAHSEDLLTFARHLSNGEIAIGIFNLGNSKAVAQILAEELAVPPSTGKTLAFKEVWSGKTAKFVNEVLRWELEPYDCAVFRAKVVNL